MTARFRFNDQTEEIHEYRENKNDYIFAGKYHTFNITSKMSEKKKHKIAEEYLDKLEDKDLNC